jgi:chromosome segregation ATPase
MHWHVPSLRCERVSVCVLEWMLRHEQRRRCGVGALDKKMIAQVETLQMNAKDMSAAAATSKGDYEDKIRAGNEALASAKAELAGCGTKLSYALAEQARLQKLVKELESSLSSANTETGAAVSTQRELDSKASALQARVAKLESDAAARNSELEKQKALAAKEAMEGKSAKASHSKIELQLADLQKQVIQSAASVKDLKVESNSWEEKCAELERKLISREAAMKDNALLTTKVSALEHEVAQLKQDRKQMQDDSGTHLGLLNQTVKKHEQLMEKYNGDMTKLKTESAEELRKVRSEFDELQEERDMFFKELTRFLGMPNPVGVGMALVENQAKDANGQVVKTTVVGGMQGGLAADLSGVIRIGDELVQVRLA